MMSSFITTYTAQAQAAVRSSAADRGGFLFQAGAMAANNLFVLAMWFLFFAGFKSVGGWRMADMALLNALLALIVGLSGVVAGGYRDMARQIASGMLDALLTQPKAVLPRLLAHESKVTGWGDIVTGALLFLVADVSWFDAGWIAFALLCGMTVFISTATMFASIAFWASGARSFARDLTDFMISFSFYPGSIYGGMLKVVTFTVFPAAFITLIPVALIRSADWTQALILGAATVTYATAAIILFGIGLRRYQRGESPVAGD
jgi:ABC-2 type transport system permease protein